MEVHCVLVEYENGKVKPARYLVQIADFNEPNDQWQEWFPERRELVTDPGFARAIDFTIFIIRVGDWLNEERHWCIAKTLFLLITN